MLNLNDAVVYLDEILQTRKIADYSGAVNGLQLESTRGIPRIIAAVDASLPVIQAVAADGPGLLIVHHGMFWNGVQTLTGPYFQKIKVAMDAGLAIYSSHLPLDIHPEFGNNVLLAREIGLKSILPFTNSKNAIVGVTGDWDDDLESLLLKMHEVCGARLHVCPSGGNHISRIAIITGGAGSEVAKISALGIDTFITGEGPHWSYTLAEELQMNLIYAGHYTTETYGVKKIAAHLAEKFQLPWHFQDHPTGL